LHPLLWNWIPTVWMNKNERIDSPEWGKPRSTDKAQFLETQNSVKKIDLRIITPNEIGHQKKYARQLLEAEISHNLLRHIINNNAISKHQK
jgi:hypothetical protein